MLKQLVLIFQLSLIPLGLYIVYQETDPILEKGYLCALILLVLNLMKYLAKNFNAK
jgi:hypothetical protein